jgi:hypothetical protein
MYRGRCPDIVINPPMAYQFSIQTSSFIHQS